LIIKSPLNCLCAADEQTTLDNSVEETQSPYNAQNFAWIVAAIGVVYFTGIIDTVLNDDTIYR